MRKQFFRERFWVIAVSKLNIGQQCHAGWKRTNLQNMPTLVQPVSHMYILKIMVCIFIQSEIVMAVCVVYFLFSLWALMEVQVKTVNVIVLFPSISFSVFSSCLSFTSSFIVLVGFHAPRQWKTPDILASSPGNLLSFSLMNFQLLELKKKSPQGRERFLDVTNYSRFLSRKWTSNSWLVGKWVLRRHGFWFYHSLPVLGMGRKTPLHF